MVYNRCVGTRACSGYCPYKVRRFNYPRLHRAASRLPIQAAQQSRMSPCARAGVMEKCTYCVQRIAEARIDRRQGRRRRSPTASVQTACQSACPTQAISFGDLADPKSAVVVGQARGSAQLRPPRRAEPAAAHDLSRRARARLHRSDLDRPHLDRKGGLSDDERLLLSDLEPGAKPVRLVARDFIGKGADLRLRSAPISPRSPSPIRCGGAGGSPSPPRWAMVGVLALGLILWLFIAGRRRLGQQHPGHLGAGHRQLRLVDRRRVGRAVHLGDVPAARRGMALRAESDHGDAVPRRGRRRRGLSDHPPRPPLVLLLEPAVSEHASTLWPQFRSPLFWDAVDIISFSRRPRSPSGTSA